MSIRDQVAKVMCEAINKFEIQGAFWLFLLIFSTKMKNLLQLLFKKSSSRRPDLAGLYTLYNATHKQKWLSAPEKMTRAGVGGGNHHRTQKTISSVDGREQR